MSCIPTPSPCPALISFAHDLADCHSDLTKDSQQQKQRTPEANREVFGFWFTLEATSVATAICKSVCWLTRVILRLACSCRGARGASKEPERNS